MFLLTGWGGVSTRVVPTSTYWGVYLLGFLFEGGGLWGVPGWRPPPTHTHTTVVGTHPTGMYSCLCLTISTLMLSVYHRSSYQAPQSFTESANL